MEQIESLSRKIVIVIPAFNESRTIASVIRSIPRSLEIKGRLFTVLVIVVDDYSKDNTIEEAEKAGAVVLRHAVNSGAGAATRTGLRYVQLRVKDADYVITIDADGQHATSDIKRLVQCALLNEADLVVGNRLHAGNKKDMPWFRTLGNRGISFISRLLFDIRTEDTQSGLRLYTVKSLPMIAEFTLDRYGFCTETLWLARRAGLRVDEVPISVTYTAESLKNGQNNWGAIELIKDLISVRLSN